MKMINWLTNLYISRKHGLLLTKCWLLNKCAHCIQNVTGASVVNARAHAKKLYAVSEILSTCNSFFAYWHNNGVKLVSDHLFMIMHTLVTMISHENAIFLGNNVILWPDMIIWNQFHMHSLNHPKKTSKKWNERTEKG